MMVWGALVLLLCCSYCVTAQEQGAELLVYPDRLVSVVAGSAGSLTCVAYGQPQPSITWLKDGVPIENGSYATIYDTYLVDANMSFAQSILEICMFLPEQDGNYSCYTENQLGNFSFPFEINVIYDMVMLEDSPSDTLANIVDEVTFTCTASSLPSPTIITWYKDGSLLEPNSSNISSNAISNTTITSILYLADLKLADAGLYSCNATDPIDGKDSREFTLTIQSEVELLIYPTNSTTTAGFSSSFTCAVAGIPLPQITWQRNGTPLLPDTYNVTENSFSNISSYFAISILTLCDLRLSDSDLYSCAASNNISQREVVTVFTLSVEDSATILTSPNSSNLRLGMSIQLTCNVSGLPLPQVSWNIPTRTGTQTVNSNSNSVVEEDRSQGRVGLITSTLRISQVNASEAGQYECVAENYLGNDTAVASIFVYAAAVVTSQVEGRVYLHAGTSRDLECMADGLPTPNITWIRNEMEIITNDSFSNVVIIEDILIRPYDVNTALSRLDIQEATPFNEGNYTCMATNAYGEQQLTFNLRILTNDVMILSVPEDTTANTTERVSFTCSASGIPVPNIAWFKDGSLVDPSSASINAIYNGTVVTSVLDLGMVDLSDAAQYSCNASDPVSGTDVQEFSLTLQSAVELILYPTNTTANASSSVAFACMAAGVPPPQILWFKNGTLISRDVHNISESMFSNATSHFTTSTLVLCDLVLSDSNLYSCDASNNVSYGLTQASGTFAIMVEDPPTFITSPANETLAESSTLSLNCTVSGLPLPQITWLRTGEGGRLQVLPTVYNTMVSQSIVGRVSSSLVIRNVNYSHAGLYECMAVNSLGSNLAPAIVTVYAVPEIVDGPPLDLDVHAGMMETLTCVGRGIPIPTLTWLRNGMEIQNETLPNVFIVDRTISSFTIESTLTLEVVEPILDGNYTCRAGNAYGGVANTSILTILTDDVAIQSAPMDTTVTITDTVLFLCSASGIPVPTIAWYRNGSLLNSSSASVTYNGTEVTSVLDLGMLQVADAGVYTCNASSSTGSTTRDFTLTLQRPAAVVAYPSSSMIVAGNSSSFTCIGSAIPPPTIMWYKGDNLLSSETFNISHSFFTNATSYFTVSILTLCDLELLDSDVYGCTATNTINEGQTQDSINFTLEVQEPPIFVTSPTNVTLMESSTLSLNCTVSGLPLPQITWRRTGQDGGQQQLTTDGNIRMEEEESQSIAGRKTSLLLIESVNFSHAGLYDCVASNFLGNVSSTQASITVYVPATVMTNNTDRAFNVSDNVILQCIANGYPLPSVAWMKDGVLLTDTEEVNITTSNIPPMWVISLLEICDLSLASAGNYECVAMNTLVTDSVIFRNENRSSSQIIVLDDPMLVIHPYPARLVVAAGEEFSLNCTATGFPVPSIAWYLNNSEVSPGNGVTIMSSKNTYIVFSRILISRAGLNHTGGYHCQANNTSPAGVMQEDMSNLTLVQFTSPPRLLQSPIDRALFGVEDVTFSCQFESLPAATVTWTFLPQNGESSRQSEYLTTSEVSHGKDYVYTTSNLTIIRAIIRNAGQYVCNASNNVMNLIEAVTIGTGRLFVETSNFTLVRNPKATAGVVGTSVTLQCHCAAAVTGDLTMYWTKDNVNFTLPGSSQQIGGGLVTYDLEFSSLEYSNNGSYQCIAHSVFYHLELRSTSAVLVVFVPASILTSSSNTTRNVGATVTFFCEVQGSHQPSLQWIQPDGTPLPPTRTKTINMTLTNITLELQDVTLANTGNYTCTASNMYSTLPPGSDSRSFYFYVQSQPRIDPAFLRKNDVENGRTSVELMFNISEAAPPVTRMNTSLSFTRYDGRENSVMDFAFTKNSVNLTITYVSVTITNVDFDNEGNYTLMTRNNLGSSNGTIHLDVKSPPVQFGLRVQGGLYYDPTREAYVIVEGSILVFNCSFQADPEPSVVWRLNGNTLQNSTRHVITGTYANTPPLGYAEHRLVVTNVGQGDSGNYTCEGTNEYGSGLVAQTVTVIVPPTVIAVNEEEIGVETRDGSPSFISISFDITRADPKVTPADIIWTYAPNNTESRLVNETDIYPTLNFTMDRRSVTVSNLSLSDAGTFTLIATNEAGSHNASVKLIIHVEPELTDMDYSGNTTEENKNISFWCVAVGVPPPRIVWLHNDSLVLLNTPQFLSRRHSVMKTTMPSTDGLMAVNSTLKVTTVRLRDAGEYLCRVDPANINKGRPDIPEPFEVIVYPEPINYCASDPCKNGGTCSNVTNGYRCNCDPMKWKGINCETEEMFKFDPPDIVMEPEVEEFPQLFTAINITCGVFGTPQPNISWYKDGVLLPLQESQTLLIREVTLEDRGIYRCVAENFDPNTGQVKKFRDISSDTVLNIKGIAQYKAELSSNGGSGRRRKRQTTFSIPDNTIDQIASILSGYELPQYNATVYSVTRDPEDTETSPVNIIITLIAPQGSAELKESLFSRLQQVIEEVNSNVAVDATIVIAQNISRFDGCEADESVLEPLESGGLSITLNWPESDISQMFVTLQCPCGNLSLLSGQDISNAIAQRVCGGNFSHGGEWKPAHLSPCNFSSTTRQLCQVANLLNMPEEAISTLDNITSNEENIGSTEIGVTTILLEALTDTAFINQSANLTRGFLTVVDNLLDANKDEIQMSQEASNSSARILEVIETVSENIPFPENKSEVIVSLTSFAIAVQEFNPQTFTGQVFSAGLGGDFNFDNDKSIDPNALMIGKSTSGGTMETASLSIPQAIFNSLGKNTTNTRITNSVFLNDALFLGRNNTSILEVGGIIIAAALSNGRTVENLKPPVMITFLKKPSLENGSDTTCRFWDFSADDGYGEWSTRGCNVTNETDTLVICECDHLTNFAILLDPNPDVLNTPPPGFAATLSALSYIGAIISIICLIMTIITYLSSKKLRNSEAGRLLINLCLAMLGLYILYIVSLHAVADQYVCAVVGGLLHYFMLASFLAMAAEAVNLYTKLVVVLGVPPIIKNQYVLKACLIVWILPFVIVLISEAPNWKNYVSDYFCRPFDAAFYGGLMVPFILIYVFNWVIFFIIFISLLRKKTTKAETSKNASTTKLKQHFIIALTLSLLFGLGWGFGLVATTSIPVKEISYTLQTIFVLLTGFQGLLIFIMHCVRSEEARKQWKSWVYIFTCHKLSLETKKSSLTGHITSDYGKGAQGKYNKYSTLSTTAQGSQTLQRILKKEMDSSMVSHSDTIIDNENSVFSPSLDPLGEEKKIDLSSDAIAAPTQDEQTSNPFVLKIDDTLVEVNQNDLDGYGEEMEMKETKLDKLTLPFDESVKSETNSLHSVKIHGDAGPEDADSKSLRGEAENIMNEFDILWVNNGIRGSRSSLQSAGNEKRNSRLSGLEVAQHVDLAPAGSNTELPTKSHDKSSPTSETNSPVMSSSDKAPLIDSNTASDNVIVNIPDENTSNGLPTAEAT